MASKGTAIARVEERRALILSTLEERRQEIVAHLAGRLNPDRFFATVGLALVQNPKLLECEPESIIIAATKVAELGLTVGGAIPHAHLVPFRERVGDDEYVSKAKEIIDYRGLIYLGVRARAILKAEAELVYDGDVFRVVKGTENRIIHEPTFESEGWENVTHAYFVATLPNSEKKFEVMTRAQLNAAKKRAQERQRGGFSPWTSDTEEMWRKTVVKRGFKTVPIGEDLPEAVVLRRAIEQDNETWGEPDEEELREDAARHTAAATRSRLKDLKSKMGANGGTKEAGPEPEPTGRDVSPPRRPAPDNRPTSAQIQTIQQITKSRVFVADREVARLEQAMRDETLTGEQASDWIEWLSQEAKARKREGRTAAGTSDDDLDGVG